MLDANVLIFLFWPLGLRGKEDYYARAYGFLKKKNNIFFTHHIIISEVYNRILDNGHKKYCEKNPYLTKKEWRNTENGKEFISNVKTVLIEEILNNFNLCNFDLTTENIKKFLNSENLDFNDKLISEICSEKEYYLLTDDKDYINEQINIISANSKLCPK